jgi:hypothetical protein
MYRFSLAYFSKLFLSCLAQDQHKIQLEGGSKGGNDKGKL